MKVSVCMIARNEALRIAAAVNSVTGLADEIIIVDTGSTDDTVAIAHEMGIRVIEHGNRRHKAQERNHSIDAAHGDWVVILDCDETVADPEGFRQFLETTDARAVYVKTTFMEGDKSTLSFAQMRAWRRGTYFYKYRAHEVPLPPDNNWDGQVWTDFVWEHRPPSVLETGWKREHMMMLLLMDIDENPDDPRCMYYLGRELMYAQAYQWALGWFGRYMDATASGHWDRADAYGCMASCLEALGNEDKALECLQSAMREQPERRDWWGRQAVIYHKSSKHELAASMLKVMFGLFPDKMYINEYWYGPYAYDLLARCLYYAGKKAEGLPYLQKAIEMAPTVQLFRDNLKWFEESA